MANKCYTNISKKYYITWVEHSYCSNNYSKDKISIFKKHINLVMPTTIKTKSFQYPLYFHNMSLASDFRLAYYTMILATLIISQSLIRESKVLKPLNFCYLLQGTFHLTLMSEPQTFWHLEQVNKNEYVFIF